MSTLNNDLHTAYDEDQLILQAIALLENRVFKAGATLSDPSAVRDYLRLKLVAEPNEVFVAVFLNNQHEVIGYEPLFQGSIAEAPVFPRVVVQRALAVNAAAVVFAHQHPSGSSEPSLADRGITKQLKSAMALVDVRVLDHLIIGKGKPFSFADAGLL